MADVVRNKSDVLEFHDSHFGDDFEVVPFDHGLPTYKPSYSTQNSISSIASFWDSIWDSIGPRDREDADIPQQEDDMPVTWPYLKRLLDTPKIKVKSNKLKHIPDDGFDSLTNVQELRITNSRYTDGNGITSIPSSISKLDKLTILDLRGNPVKNIDHAICCLSNLTELILENCMLTHVPAFDGLKTLQRVILDNNNICKPSFSTSLNITYLSLMSNKIELFPPTLPYNLTTLNMSENCITYIPTDAFNAESSLTKLYLRDNKLESLPPTIVHLQGLKLLDVSKNRLLQLPEDIGALKLVETLNVSYNCLRILPKSICDLGEECCVLCGENPLQKPPMEVGDGGLGTIRTYFGALGRGKEVANRRLRMMLLGEPRAGKTFLAKALSTYSEGESDLNETIGIDCFEWKHCDEDNDLEVLIYDCAGQTKYMETHQLFLSTGMVFAVVVNISTYTSEVYKERIGYWIQLILAKVPKAIILIVPTHVDQISDQKEAIKEKCSGIITDVHCHVQEYKESMGRQRIGPDGEIEQEEKDGENVPCECIVDPVLPKLLSIENGDDIQVKRDIVDNAEKNEGQQSNNNNNNSNNNYSNNIRMIPVSSRYPLCGLHLFRDEIIKIANNKELCPHIDRCVPQSWENLKHFCLEQRHLRVDKPIMTLHEVQATCKIMGNEEYRQALRFIHNMGHILFFEGQQDLILLDPRWLFRLMKTLFTHRNDNIFQYNERYCKLFHIFQPEFLHATNVLFTKARLSKDLLKCIWSECIQDSTLLNQVVFLLQKFDLFHPISASSSPSHEQYLVSWFLKEQCPPDVTKPDPTNKECLITRFETMGSLPDGFFPRFVIRMSSQHILTDCTPWTCGFKGVTPDGEIMCHATKSQHSSAVITLVTYAERQNIYHMWKYIIPILNVLESFITEWKGIKYVIYSLCNSCYSLGKLNPSVWRLKSKQRRRRRQKQQQQQQQQQQHQQQHQTEQRQEQFLSCPIECQQIDRWKIYPPPGLLEKEMDEERWEGKDMNEPLHWRLKNTISEILSTEISQLQRVLDVRLGETEQKTNSREQVFEIIKLWEQKSVEGTKRCFIDALREMRPYQHKVMGMLMTSSDE